MGKFSLNLVTQVAVSKEMDTNIIANAGQQLHHRLVIIQDNIGMGQDVVLADA